MQVGDVIQWERTFSEADIRAFTQVSGDSGIHHVAPDAQGRLLVQGLLTATLPTKIGGDLDFIARRMTFEFERPVFAGDTILCKLTLTALEPGPAVTRLSCDWVCTNQHGETVMTGQARGVIRRLNAA